MNIRPPWIEHAEWVDSMSEWAVNNPPKQDDTLALMNEVWPLPAEACSEIGADSPEPHARQRRTLVVIGVALGAVICAVCLAGYRGVTLW